MATCIPDELGMRAYKKPTSEPVFKQVRIVLGVCKEQKLFFFSRELGWSRIRISILFWRNFGFIQTQQPDDLKIASFKASDSFERRVGAYFSIQEKNKLLLFTGRPVESLLVGVLVGGRPGAGMAEPHTDSSQIAL